MSTGVESAKGVKDAAMMAAFMGLHLSSGLGALAPVQRKQEIAKAAVALGVVGVVLLTSNGDFASLQFANTEFVGDLMAFGTGMCWTVYILTMKRYLTEKPETDVIAVTVVLFVTTFAVQNSVIPTASGTVPRIAGSRPTRSRARYSCSRPSPAAAGTPGRASQERLMGLGEYRRKRNLAVSREPAGVLTRARRSRRFVVQHHFASREHYDFRLELGGVLRSWAIPKGPSLVPGERRLAVQVEDHPLEYASFEGTIPQGHYGAGEVFLWDRGSWDSALDAERALRKGRLDFTLRGRKLKGAWTLVRMRPESGRAKANWLLLKRADRPARRRPPRRARARPK